MAEMIRLEVKTYLGDYHYKLDVVSTQTAHEFRKYVDECVEEFAKVHGVLLEFDNGPEPLWGSKFVARTIWPDDNGFVGLKKRGGKRAVVVNGKNYDSATNAAKDLEMSYDKIHYRLNNPAYPDYRWND